MVSKSTWNFKNILVQPKYLFYVHLILLLVVFGWKGYKWILETKTSLPSVDSETQHYISYWQNKTKKYFSFYLVHFKSLNKGPRLKKNRQPYGIIPVQPTASKGSVLKYFLGSKIWESHWVRYHILFQIGSFVAFLT